MIAKITFKIDLWPSRLKRSASVQLTQLSVLNADWQKKKLLIQPFDTIERYTGFCLVAGSHWLPDRPDPFKAVSANIQFCEERGRLFQLVRNKLLVKSY